MAVDKDLALKASILKLSNQVEELLSWAETQGFEPDKAEARICQWDLAWENLLDRKKGQKKNYEYQQRCSANIDHRSELAKFCEDHSAVNNDWYNAEHEAMAEARRAAAGQKLAEAVAFDDDFEAF